MRQWKNLLLVSCLKCVNVHGKCFFLFREDTEVFKADRNKLFASNEKQTDNHTSMLDMLHSNILVECTYHCRDVFHEKYFLVWPSFFVDLCS